MRNKKMVFKGETQYRSEPDHSKVPGVVIDYSAAKTEKYVGCPGIAVLPNGYYIASHSWFGPGSNNNRTRVHRSKDRGKSWEILKDIEGQWWSSLFFHNGALYLMGTTGLYGYCTIRRSRDGGKTWTTVKDKNTGLLFSEGEYHCAPVPVVVHKGRIWRAMEDRNPPKEWGVNFRAFVMSVPVDADLLKAKNWTSSNRVRFKQEWRSLIVSEEAEKASHAKDHPNYNPASGWLEGNVVVTPSGGIVDILRVHEPISGSTAAVIDVSDEGSTLTFDPPTGFIEFPGGCTKFVIRHDPVSKKYWSMTNYVHEDDKGGNAERTRNTLALISSPDLREWSVQSILLHHRDVEKVGFQYVDWQFEGEDIIAVSRTAYDDGIGGAHNCHDANYFTFHRIEGYRKRTLEDPTLRQLVAAGLPEPVTP